MCASGRAYPQLPKVGARQHLLSAPAGTPFEATATGHRLMLPSRPSFGRATPVSQGSVNPLIQPRVFCTALRARNHSHCATLVAKNCFPNCSATVTAAPCCGVSAVNVTNCFAIERSATTLVETIRGNASNVCHFKNKNGVNLRKDKIRNCVKSRHSAH